MYVYKMLFELVGGHGHGDVFSKSPRRSAFSREHRRALIDPPRSSGSDDPHVLHDLICSLATTSGCGAEVQPHLFGWYVVHAGAFGAEIRSLLQQLRVAFDERRGDVA